MGCWKGTPSCCQQCRSSYICAPQQAVRPAKQSLDRAQAFRATTSYEHESAHCRLAACTESFYLPQSAGKHYPKKLKFSAWQFRPREVYICTSGAHLSHLLLSVTFGALAINKVQAPAITQLNVSSALKNAYLANVAACRTASL